MGYRRNGKPERNWNAWLAGNRVALLSSGIPDEIYCDRLRFARAVMHEQDWESGWHLGLLTLAEAKVVHRLLVDQREALDFIGVDGAIRSLEAQHGLPRANLKPR